MVATLEAGGGYPLSKRGASVIWGAALALPRYISYAAYIVLRTLTPLQSLTRMQHVRI
jgi:hypothetical protein